MSLRAQDQVQRQYNTTRKIGPGRNINVEGTAIIRHVCGANNQIEPNTGRKGRNINVVMQDGEVDVRQIFNDSADNLSNRQIPGNNRRM